MGNPKGLSRGIIWRRMVDIIDFPSDKRTKNEHTRRPEFVARSLIRFLNATPRQAIIRFVEDADEVPNISCSIADRVPTQQRLLSEIAASRDSTSELNR
jgi:hypothetical protein